MRTSVYKLLSLLVMLAGMLLMAGVAGRTGIMTGLMDKMPDLIVPFFKIGGVVDWQRVGLVAGSFFVLAGINGLFFRKYSSAGKMSFRTERGEMVIALAPIQENLVRVVRALPEVRHARMRVTPSRDGQRVLVRAEVKLRDSAGQGLQKTANLVSACIYEAVNKAIGFEDRTTVQLVIRGVKVDARAAARRLREEVGARMEQETLCPVAVPPAPLPIASVTPDEPKAAVLVPVEAVLPPLWAVTPDVPKAVAPEPVEATLPPLSLIETDEPEAVAPEPTAEALSPLSSFTMDEPAFTTQKPAEKAAPTFADMPFAVATAPDDDAEDGAVRRD